MGIETVADREISIAANAIMTAQEALFAVVCQECPGTNEFQEDFMSYLEELHLTLVKARMKLKAYITD